MQSDKFVSLYCQLDGAFVAYGLLKWASTYEYITSQKDDHGQAQRCSRYDALQFNLIEAIAGRCSVGALVELVEGHTVPFCPSQGRGGRDALILDDVPESADLKKMLKGCTVKLAKREGLTSEQILRFAPQLSDRLNVGAYRVEPSLIFDELGENLIDPISSDLDTFYPLTQSLLIAAQHFTTIYRPFTGARHSTVKRPNFSGYAQPPGEFRRLMSRY